MDILLDRIKREVARYLSRFAEPRMGRITSYDPKRHAVKVQVLPEADFPLQPGDDASTGWIPLAPICAGNGWGLYFPPALGTQVMLVHQENHPGSPVAIVSINDQNNPPPAVPASQMWLVDSQGSYVKLTNDGTISINGQIEFDMTGPTIKVTAATEIDLVAPTINVTGSTIVNLGGTGGRAVARVGDPISTGGTIEAGSAIVFST